MARRADDLGSRTLEQDNHEQILWLTTGTILPFLLFFILPLLGADDRTTLTVAKVALLGLHILIMTRDVQPSKALTGHHQANGPRAVQVLRFGFALGTTSALTYLGCALVMATVPRKVTTQFFNSIFHGIDLTPILRWEMSWSEMGFGVLSLFTFTWLFGAVVAVLYNVTAGHASAPTRGRS